MLSYRQSPSLWLCDQHLIDSLCVHTHCVPSLHSLPSTGALKVSGLLRVQVGEGLEREEGDKADFAAEVAAMAGGGK